jgi:D-amino-acid dehydrogenase
MRIIVLGAGVVGVCTAWYLAKSGHEVVIVDRQFDAGSEATWGNAGVIGPSQAYSMASPRIWTMVRESLFTNSGPLKFRLPPEPVLIPWMIKFLSFCTDERSKELTRKKFRLSMYSLNEFHDIVSQTGIKFDDSIAGSINIFRDQKAADSAWLASKIMQDQGLVLNRLSRDELIEAQPCLSSIANELAGGFRSTIDWTGNPALFTRKLLKLLETNYKVTSHLGKSISAIRVDGNKISHIEVDDLILSGDQYVLALGSSSPIISRTVGIRLPVYPVKGYSVTARLFNDSPSMTGSIVDSSKRLAVSRLGSSVRVTFKAEFVGHDTSIDRSVFNAPIDYLQRLFGDSLDLKEAQFWSGFRPMTPSGLPIVGKSQYDNLYLNTGHGHLGWTMAPGTGRLLANLINGVQSELDLSLLTERI